MGYLQPPSEPSNSSGLEESAETGSPYLAILTSEALAIVHLVSMRFKYSCTNHQ